MTDILDDIPTIEDSSQQLETFPVEINPMDREWWLNPDQKKICDAFLGECRFDKTCAVQKVRVYKNNKSARAAGAQFFQKARIRRYLWLRAKALTEKFEINQEDILKDLIEVKEMAMGRQASHVYASDKNGTIYPDFIKVVNLPVAKQALEQLGKYHEISMWTEKHEHEVSVVNFNFNMNEPPPPTTKIIEHEEG